jgi:hypothetical protein
LQEIRHGKGRIFRAADPVELAEGIAPAAALYRHVLGKFGVKEPFELLSEVPAGVLVCPVSLERDVLYVLVSEAAHSAELDLRDKPTGARLKVVLRGEHAALALIDGAQRKLTARYGF